MKTFKRICALSLTVLLMSGTSTLPTSAAVYAAPSALSAAASVNDDYNYTVNSNNTVTITKYKGRETDVKIPQSISGKTVTEIGSSAFKNCTTLKTVYIPKSIRTINGNAFIGCNNLQSFKTDSKSSYFTAVNGVLFNKNKTSLKIYPNGRSGKYTVPSSVTVIDKYAFSECNKLTYVYVPGSVKTIEFNAFAYCLGLKNITLNNGLTTLKIAAFNGCKNLESIDIPESVSVIEKYAFSSCQKIKSITIPEKVTVLNFSLFEGCTSLNYVKLPDKITKVYSNVFDHCSSLVSVKLPESVTNIYGMAFCCCENLKSLTILSNNAQIDKIAFTSCPNLTVYAKKGSTAEAAAKANGVKFSDKKPPMQDASVIGVLDRTVCISAKVIDGTEPYTFAVYYKNINDKNWSIAQNYSSNNKIRFTLPKSGTYKIYLRTKDAERRMISKEYTVSVR